MNTVALRHVTLRVRDLRDTIGFYQRLGFVVARADASAADLAIAPETAPILTLQHDPAAVTPPRSAAGLFHVALLFPTRAALGGWLRGAVAGGIEFDGFADHAVSEALYFSDPEGNGLEFYADRPRESWPYENGEVSMVTRPLDARSMLNAGTVSAAPLAGAGWGHLHLRVTNLDRSESFYRDALGLEVTQRSFPGARFLAADSYHHHLGLNIWGSPQQPQPDRALGIASATFATRAAGATREVRDPDAITIRIEPWTPPPLGAPGMT